MPMCNVCVASPACRARRIIATTPNAAARRPSASELRDAVQRICLKHVFYGYRRVTATLRRQGMVVNAKKVQRLMREDNLLAQRKTPFLKPPAERPSGVLVVPNLVRGLVPSAPDQIWVADITHVHLAKTFAYLAVILDAFSRKAVGWAFDDTLDASLAITALEKAIAARAPAPPQPDPSLRPRRAIRVHCLSPAACRSRYHHQHEQAGQSLRQRQG